MFDLNFPLVPNIEQTLVLDYIGFEKLGCSFQKVDSYFSFSSLVNLFSMFHFHRSLQILAAFV